ncbi:UNVERIFIED_CONTAM: MerR family transcriptional regulator [Halobacillus marinus]|uniref:MerR family transcriptional regulator n=1 Tax=Bacillaceae TaxID=186817 RepID=UPI0002A4EDCA|nr:MULTISPECIES: MerR family transcriptional regulator [Bacillaceae]ELK45365.1 MerR family transcriptional regulator [Halobacillus sp. BAB-2008]QHT46897.1 MerR family transcriptional regulator [Bacillus sp. SB49]
MDTARPKYNIKAVSQRLGIQPGTLRAWERRYQMIRPSRNEAGHRLYTEEHIRILKWLMEKVDRGFTISQAVSLLESNQEVVVDTDNRDHSKQLVKLGDDLLDALLSFSENDAQKHLDHAFSLFTPETVAIDIIGPILINIGDLWEANKITSAHEHFASQFIRSRIGMMLLSIPTDSMLPKALLVCGPNERHELGLLIFALFLKRKGYDVVFLGQSIAGGDIDIVIDEIKPKYMFMSCTLKKNIPITVRLAESLQKQYPDLVIGLGGYAYDRLSELDKKRIEPFIVGNSKKAWEVWLKDN